MQYNIAQKSLFIPAMNILQGDSVIKYWNIRWGALLLLYYYITIKYSNMIYFLYKWQMAQNSLFIPTMTIFLQGDSVIRYYELVDEDPYFYYITMHTSQHNCYLYTLQYSAELSFHPYYEYYCRATVLSDTTN